MFESRTYDAFLSTLTVKLLSFCVTDLVYSKCQQRFIVLMTPVFFLSLFLFTVFFLYPHSFLLPSCKVMRQSCFS